MTEDEAHIEALKRWRDLPIDCDSLATGTAM
jgi:hypothetical protein